MKFKLLAVTLGLLALMLVGCSNEPVPEDTKPDAAALKENANKAPVTKAAPGGGGGMPPASATGLDPTK